MTRGWAGGRRLRWAAGVRAGRVTRGGAEARREVAPTSRGRVSNARPGRGRWAGPLGGHSLPRTRRKPKAAAATLRSAAAPRSVRASKHLSWKPAFFFFFLAQSGKPGGGLEGPGGGRGERAAGPLRPLHRRLQRTLPRVAEHVPGHQRSGRRVGRETALRFRLLISRQSAGPCPEARARRSSPPPLGSGSPPRGASAAFLTWTAARPGSRGPAGPRGVRAARRRRRLRRPAATPTYGPSSCGGRARCPARRSAARRARALRALRADPAAAGSTACASLTRWAWSWRRSRCLMRAKTRPCRCTCCRDSPSTRTCAVAARTWSSLCNAWCPTSRLPSRPRTSASAWGASSCAWSASPARTWASAARCACATWPSRSRWPCATPSQTGAARTKWRRGGAGRQAPGAPRTSSPSASRCRPSCWSSAPACTLRCATVLPEPSTGTTTMAATTVSRAATTHCTCRAGSARRAGSTLSELPGGARASGRWPCLTPDPQAGAVGPCFPQLQGVLAVARLCCLLLETSGSLGLNRGLRCQKAGLCHVLGGVLGE